jgi:glycosyltransferase involved in cell wall biosynthesis
LQKSTSNAERIVVIRSAVDVDSIPTTPDCCAFREEFDIDDDDFVIAVVGQLIPRKGHRFLFDVVPNLRDLHPKLRIIIFGTGAAEAQLRALAKQLNLGGTVRFAGFRDDLDSYLACFNLLVHPAIEEGLGIAMLKAAAASVPVVAFDIAGSQEAVVHGRTGVLVPVADVRVLQKAISTMIEEPQMCREFGAAGRKRMQDEFSLQNMVASHVELYRSVLHEKF